VRKASIFQEARRQFHAALLASGLLSIKTRTSPQKGLPPRFPSNADGNSAMSIRLAQTIYDRIQSESTPGGRRVGRISGNKFGQITRSFVQETFGGLEALRPGKWDYSYREEAIFKSEIAVLLASDYAVQADILIVRELESDEHINAERRIVDRTVAVRSSLRERNNSEGVLHACISCSWTLRDRSEVLSISRNRKGRAPYVAVVTGEPLPSRLASVALGTSNI
jgi:hypothetical protein